MDKITTSHTLCAVAALSLAAGALVGCSTVSSWKVLNENSFDNIRPGIS